MNSPFCRDLFIVASNGTISKLARAENVLPNISEVILTHENLCFAIDELSQKRKRHLLPWNEKPISLIQDSFFLIALCSNGIEIQLLNAKAGKELSQVIKLEGFSQLCIRQSGGLYVASPIQGRLVLIERKPGHQIVEQLLKCHAFEDALDAIRSFPLDQVRARIKNPLTNFSSIENVF